jgi:hypothetical protein
MKSRREIVRASQAKINARRRSLVSEVLGDCCVRCGASGPVGFLDIDHINGDAWVDRHRYGSGIMGAGRYIEEHGAEATQKRFQLLCPNCHRVKTIQDKALNSYCMQVYPVCV